MSRHCRAPGCGARTTSHFSVYCGAHKSRLRRHGAVDQETITKADLKGYLRLVRGRIERNQESPLWAQLDGRWMALVGHAKGIVAAFERGQPGYRHERIAAQEVIKLASHVQPREVVETVLAMVMLQEDQPRRFRSDRGFRTQLVRRVRGLTDVNAGSWWDNASGRVKRAYRELTPRAAAVMGQWLAEALGPAGLYLARLERADQQKKQEQTNALHRALMEIK